MSSRTADLLASITPEDLASAAREMEQGTGTWSVLSNRPAVRELITSMQSVHSGTPWSIYNKRTTRMIAISYTIQFGQAFWWLTFSPSDNNSPIVLRMAGIEVDVTSRLKAEYPDYAKRLQVVASDHVASAFFYHSVTDAVFRCLLRVGAKDSDGGVVGRVKAHVAMTEEQKRLTLHCHAICWVYGYSDFDSFRALLDKSPEKYAKLAQFLEQVIFNQVATLGDVNLALYGHGSETTSTSSQDTSASSDRSRDPLIIDARQRLPRPPPAECFPRADVDRCLVHDEAYARLMYLDLAELTPAVNLHSCQPTCHKYNHGDSCR